jgi:nitronate monooxygenase
MSNRSRNPDDHDIPVQDLDCWSNRVRRRSRPARDANEVGWSGRRHQVLATSATRTTAQFANFIGRTVVEGRSCPVPRFSSAVPTAATTGRIEEMAMYCGTSCTAIGYELAGAAVVAELAGVLPRR